MLRLLLVVAVAVASENAILAQSDPPPAVPTTGATFNVPIIVQETGSVWAAGPQMPTAPMTFIGGGGQSQRARTPGMGGGYGYSSPYTRGGFNQAPFPGSQGFGVPFVGGRGFTPHYNAPSPGSGGVGGFAMPKSVKLGGVVIPIRRR